jgi:hypothetical protein
VTTSIGLNATAAALVDVFQDAALQSALNGQIFDSLPEDVARPCALYVLYPESNDGGFGLTRGPFKLNLRTHVFSELGSVSEVTAIDDLIVGLLTDAKLTTLSGSFTHSGTIAYRPNGVPAFESELNGVKVHEKVSDFSLWVEMA